MQWLKIYLLNPSSAASLESIALPPSDYDVQVAFPTFAWDQRSVIAVPPLKGFWRLARYPQDPVRHQKDDQANSPKFICAAILDAVSEHDKFGPGEQKEVRVKLSNYLEDVGQPVSYYPSIAMMLGSVKAGLFFCQLFYWRDKQINADGWLYKTADELRRETGLSRKEQMQARKTLVELGILEEHYDRLRHRLNFRLKLERFDGLWEGSKQKEGQLAEPAA